MPKSTEGLRCATGVTLMLTHTGPVYSPSTGWSRCRAQRWVIDYINHGWQQQRLGDGPAFKRQSAVAALYAPGTVYHEYREADRSYDESWLVFTAEGETEEDLTAFTGSNGWCHLHDGSGAFGECLREAGAWMVERRPGYRYRVPGLVCELLAMVVTSQPMGPTQRRLQPLDEASARSGLSGAVESYIRDHLDSPLQVRELADHVGMGESAFAHRYPEEAGETPYQTILRLKLGEAKRLLLRREMSIKETAYALGFSNEFNFSRAFKRVEGMAPSVYVRAMKAKQG